MQAYKELAEIVRREQVADNIYRFTVKAPDIATGSKPGQFVMVRTAEGLDPLLRRPFSIHQVAVSRVCTSRSVWDSASRS